MFVLILYSKCNAYNLCTSNNYLYLFLGVHAGDADEYNDALLCSEVIPRSDMPPVIDLEAAPDELENLSPLDALDHFQNLVIDTSGPTQLFRVSRLEGLEEMKRDIFGFYKSSRNKLVSPPKVRFEDEEAVGSGPVREYLLVAMKIVDEGIGSASRKPTLFFEGQDDHRVPIHDQSLRLMGAFKAVGRIIGHCALHGGPALHGVSPAVKFYWIHLDEDNQENPLPISIQDVADIELRDYISQVSRHHIF